MTYSIAERIASAVQTALLAEPQMGAVGPRVERARDAAFSRDEVQEGALNIRMKEERSRVSTQELDDCELDLDIEVNVRSSGVWESAADAIAVEVHARVMGADYAQAGIQLATVRKTGRSNLSEEGDYTAGQTTLTYTFRYLTRADDISTQT